MGRPSKPPRESKVCCGCGVDKSRSEYYLISYSETRSKYLPSLCRICNIEDRRKRSLVKLYGITDEEYVERLKAQAGVCTTCFGTNVDGKRLSVDHDHKPGKVRGLLCSACNLALGSVRDNKEALQRMVRYLCGE